MAEPDLSPCAIADLEAVAALVNLAYRSEGGWTHEVGVVDGNRIDAQALADDIAQPQTTILLMREAGDLVGCVRIDIDPESPGLAGIGMVAVPPGLQDRGLGRRLLAAAEAFALRHGARRAELTVVSVRAALIAWYERQGYRRTGVTKPFHVDGRFGRPRQPLELAVLEKPLA